MRKCFVLLLFFILTFSSTVIFLPVKAQFQGNITINADGSISPSNAPIEQKGNIYSLTSSIAGRITVNKNDLVLDGNGHTLTYGSGPGNVYALSLTGASNDTVKNLTVRGGWYGISLYETSDTLIVNNTILETEPSVPPFEPSGAINVEFGSSNVIMNNNLTDIYSGMRFLETKNNLILGNTIENSTSFGIVFWGASNNTIYHNNFINNSKQVYMGAFNSQSSGNVWDNGYPYGGNFWSDYQTKYPTAREMDSSGIGDASYVIDSQNKDWYPLLERFTSATYLLQTTPPKISLLSPLNQTSSNSNVSLIFTVDKMVNWTGYSLDGKDNMTVPGNTTLIELSSGSHEITVYGNDTFGNMGSSETIIFTIPGLFPFVPVAAVALVAVVAACAGLLLLTRRKRHKEAKQA